MFCDIILVKDPNKTNQSVHLISVDISSANVEFNETEFTNLDEGR